MGKPRGFQQIVGPGSAQGFTLPSTRGDIEIALVQATHQDCRWTDDPLTLPTTTGVGMLLQAGDSIVYAGDLTRFRIIQTASTAVVNIAYYESMSVSP